MKYIGQIAVTIAFFGLSVVAILPNLEGHQNPENINVEQIDNEVPSILSLPNLLQVDDLKELEENWEIFGDLKLDTGRLLIGKPAAAIWAIPYLENTQTDWTIELTFRSTGTASKDLQFDESNGLSFWLINTDNSLPLIPQNMGNFGGPSQYDGFQFVVNNKDIYGLKIYNNDGTKTFTNDINEAIGSCAFNYLDSQIPFSLRISYSDSQKWFKVQVDNNLCFKTDKIKFPNELNDLAFGVSASIDKSSNEVFEILGLNVWHKITNDAIDDHGLMSDGQVQVVVTEVEQPSEFVKPSAIRESLMERNRKYHEEIEKQRSGAIEEAGQEEKTVFAKTEESDSKLLLSLTDISKRLTQLDFKLDTLEKSESYEFENVKLQLEKLKNIQDEQKHIVANLEKSVEDFKTTITQHYSQMLSAVSKLNERVIGEVREQQFGLDDLSKKVDLLMSHHRDIANQYQQYSETTNNGLDFASIVNSIVRWFLIPVVIALLALTILVYRLKHDIKHSKLL
ncbi:concanavalin A-like lectin/glucanase domain-containing protein [Scheffersomyces xylosifermentans]|uniref:concanavalin A-like lectin/glucanase domain-containing protein n=1 Tax=Scheffersomyces xylosifermentans TaxID=1304137 RepID=UPI00315C83F3